MLERGSSGLRSPSASTDSSLFSFVPTWKTTEKTTPIPKTISDRFCNYTQRGTPYHPLLETSSCCPEITRGHSGRSYQTLGSHFRDRLYRLWKPGAVYFCQPNSFCCSRLALSRFFKKLIYRVNNIQTQPRPPSLYAECKSITDGFMSSVQSSPYKYNTKKYTGLTVTLLLPVPVYK